MDQTVQGAGSGGLAGATVGIGGAVFRLDELVGAGATAVVWHASRTEGTAISEHIAVKVLKAEACASPVLRERFRREGMLLCGLAHPGLVRGYGRGLVRGYPYIALEYVHGAPLSTLISTGPLQPDDAITVALDIAAVLNHLYFDGRVSAHRDIKPANIIVLADGHAKLVDLGVARSVLHGEDDLDTGFLGTLAYMAPEQIEDGSRADIRGDLYALGAVFYEMCAGRRAFGEGERRGALLERLRGQVPQLPHEGALRPRGPRRACQAVVDALLVADPAARAQTPAQAIGVLMSARHRVGRRLPGVLPAMDHLVIVAEVLICAAICTGLVLVAFRFLL